jgi:hypothetical protein
MAMQPTILAISYSMGAGRAVLFLFPARRFFEGRGRFMNFGD